MLLHAQLKCASKFSVFQVLLLKDEQIDKNELHFMIMKFPSHQYQYQGTQGPKWL